MSVMYVVFTALFLDSLVTTIIIPIVKDLFSVNDEYQVGVVLAVKALTQIVCNPFIGYILPKFGSRNILLLGNILLILGNIIFSLSTDFPLLVVSRMIQGISSAMVGTAGLSMVAENYSSKRERGHAMGNAMFGLALGNMAGPPTGGLLFIYGRWPGFIIISIIVLIESLFLIALPNGQNSNGYEDESTKSLLEGEECASSVKSFPTRRILRRASSSSIDSFRSFDEIRYLRGGHLNNNTMGSKIVSRKTFSYKEILCNPSILLLLLALFVTNISLSFTEPTLPLLWKNTGLTDNSLAIGLLFAIQTCAYTITCSVAGRFPELRTKLVFAGLIIMSIAIPPLFLLEFLKEDSIIQRWTSTIIGLLGTGLAVGLVDGTSLPLLANMFDRMAMKTVTPIQSPSSYSSFDYDNDSTLSISNDDTLSSDFSLSSISLNENEYNVPVDYGKLFALTEIAINSGFFLGPIIGTTVMGLCNFTVAASLFIAGNVLVLLAFVVCLIFRSNILSSI